MENTKNVFGTILTIFLFVGSMLVNLVAVAPVTMADVDYNGIGQMTVNYDTLSAGYQPPYLLYTFVNNGPPGVCVDEIIITPDSHWTGTAVLGDVTGFTYSEWSNDANLDSGNSDLTHDDQSIRIFSDTGICSGTTATIKITGLVAPSGPPVPYHSVIDVYTSDFHHNEPSTSHVREKISALPSIYITNATGLKFEYLHLTSFSSNGFTGTGTGAWGKLDTLYIASTQAESGVTVKINTLNGPKTIWGPASLVAGMNTLNMDYSSVLPADSDPGYMEYGYIKDGRSYMYIITGAPASTLTLKGHVDEPRGSIAPSISETGLIGAVGTIIDVDHANVKRLVNVQLIDAAGLDVEDAGVLYGFGTDLSTMYETPELNNNNDGNLYIDLNPGHQKGIAHVNVNVMGLSLIPSITENAGINAGAPTTWDITKGKNVNNLIAGGSQEIEATVYDQFGNVITNNPSHPMTTFTLTTEPAPGDARVVQVVPSGEQGTHNYEEEETQLGIAQVFLITSTEIGSHVVNVCVTGLGCKLATINTAVGTAGHINVVAAGDQQRADECMDFTFTIVDDNGNLVHPWQSQISATLEGNLGELPSGLHIQSTTMTGTQYTDGNTMVTGYEYDGQGTVTVCGCSTLGDYKLVVASDTLESGYDIVDVINTNHDWCIDVNADNNNLLSCQDGTPVNVGIIDSCGNRVVDQECGSGGIAQACVDLSLTSLDETDANVSLSNSHVCVDLNNPTLTPPVSLIRNNDACGDVGINAVTSTPCCPAVYSGQLPMCHSESVALVGMPDNIKTGFDSKNPATQPLVEQGKQVVSEGVTDTFTAYDMCGNVVTDFNGEADVTLKNDDCTQIMTVDSPLTLTGDGEKSTVCSIREPTVLQKVVITNCGETDKQWTDMELKDIMVDKLKFDVTAPQYYTGPIDSNPRLNIYYEHGGVGFNPAMDPLVAIAKVQPVSFTELVDFPDNFMHNFQPDWYARGWMWDDQRAGGVLIRAGDTAEFYVALAGAGTGGSASLQCGDYAVNYQGYQDYTSEDVQAVAGQQNGEENNVDDQYVNSDDFQYVPHKGSRNNDYMHHSPPWYGFGDTFVDSLQFTNGVASFDFSDLTAETIHVTADNVELSGATCDYEGMGTCYSYLNCNQAGVLQGDFSKEGCDENPTALSYKTAAGVCYNLDQPSTQEPILVTPMPEDMTFIEQPATQVVLINHDGFESKTASCEASTEGPGDGFLLNVQTADGFQNPHAKENVDVSLSYCVMAPFINPVLENKFHDWDENWLKDRGDTCFTKQELKQFIAEHLYGGYFQEVINGNYFGDEINRWVDKYFENQLVQFWNVDQNGNPTTPITNAKVTTDALGQAQVYVTSPSTGLFKITATPYALDADYTFVAFKAGAPAKLDIAALPSFGVPADGEEEAMLLVRALDACGNIVYDPVDDVTVTATSGSGQATMSSDFSCNNNYDADVTGDINYDHAVATDGIHDHYSMLGMTCLQTLDDFPETATYTATAPSMDSDSTQVVFQGAPVKLKITEIKPSDRLPADGMTGAWVTVEVQDKYNNRVTGYLGEGFSGDPGDNNGMPNYLYNNICIDLDDLDASVPPWFMNINDATFGWMNLHEVHHHPSVYCGDLLFGKGSFYVTYDNPNNNHGGTVSLQVWDAEPYDGQEIQENGLPQSHLPTQLTPDTGMISFVDPATKWSVQVIGKTVAAANGQDSVLLRIVPENQYGVDIRQSVVADVMVGGTAESGAAIAALGEMPDSLNPTHARVLTDPVTGEIMMVVSSTQAGTAEITVTGGDAYICPSENDRDKNGHERGCFYSGRTDLEPMTVYVDFREAFNNRIELVHGWNYISVPQELSHQQASAVLASLTHLSVAMKFDQPGQHFTGIVGTDNIKPLNGYLLYMTAPETLVLTPATLPPGAIVIPDTKAIAPGWNAIGMGSLTATSAEAAFIAIDGVYTHFLDWIEAGQQFSQPIVNSNAPGIDFSTTAFTVLPGQGYLLWATGSGTLPSNTVPNSS